MLGLSGAALSVTKSVISIIAATVTIVFLTFFMLLEGRAWVERFYSLLPGVAAALAQASAHDIYKTVGGYVTGNLLISLIAGASITIVLLAHGRAVCGRARAARRVPRPDPARRRDGRRDHRRVVAFLHSVPAGIIVVVFFIVYQQLENHFLQPVIYGRTVQLSPLAVLISVLVGAELAGILGALAAIPVAGALQVIVRDQLAAGTGRAAGLRAHPS